MIDFSHVDDPHDVAITRNNSKDIGIVLVSSLLNLNLFHILSSVSIIIFEHVIADWEIWICHFFCANSIGSCFLKNYKID